MKIKKRKKRDQNPKKRELKTTPNNSMSTRTQSETKRSERNSEENATRLVQRCGVSEEENKRKLRGLVWVSETETYLAG